MRRQDNNVVFIKRFGRNGSIDGAGWLAEFGNQVPGVCGRVVVSARSSGMLSAAGTAELSTLGKARF